MDSFVFALMRDPWNFTDAITELLISAIFVRRALMITTFTHLLQYSGVGFGKDSMPKKISRKGAKAFF
jgi:hypothetical protein